MRQSAAIQQIRNPKSKIALNRWLTGIKTERNLKPHYE
ncbi:hypothetical protein D1AOALGA4SA_8204 [Olavius algarvensis Delta 1 endosymbiont]|nr:hypothetical protein D1AOALGA4SA_8204 [Olavius algarvensis Delta 1 endosymbiont]